MRSFDGLVEFEANEDKVLNPKNMLKKFFKKEALNFQVAIENPESTRMIKADFVLRRGKVLADINRKCFKKVNEKTSKQTE